MPLPPLSAGTSSRDSLLSWVRLLERRSPRLGQLPVVFTLRSPETGVATTAEQPETGVTAAGETAQTRDRSAAGDIGDTDIGDTETGDTETGDRPGSNDERTEKR